MDGEIEVTIGDDVRTVHAGDVTAAPAGALHAYRILSEGARMYVVTSGHRASAFFADLDANAEPGMPTPDTLPAIIDVARRNGLTSPLFV
ncbi:MAG: cupin domain-containing protein [Ilumatobacteraceae bacterium]